MLYNETPGSPSGTWTEQVESRLQNKVRTINRADIEARMNTCMEELRVLAETVLKRLDELYKNYLPAERLAALQQSSGYTEAEWARKKELEDIVVGLRDILNRFYRPPPLEDKKELLH
ncbi:unnamed protein product [marine sediment metagenome]|uniref:Uncharacterized protein n=1 Tax=marine sediment metagenome TaxID=412755 RepID=X0U8C2_9ZZZZ